MILFFALLAALIAAPGSAMADPISSAIFTFLATAGATVGTATAIAAFVTQLFGGIAVSLLGQLLGKKPKVNGQGIQTEQTTTGDVTPQKFIVGTYAAEGHAVAPAYSRFKNNGILTYILEVSNIPVTGLTGRIIINGKYSDIEAPSNSAGPFNEVPVNSGRRILTEFRQDDTDPTAWLWFYDGTQTAADPTLVTYYGSHPDRPWTAAHVLRGTAYAVLEFALDPEIYQGLPSVRFEVQGIKLYDPRKDTTVGGSGAHRWADPATWDPSSNPQVINYNILRGITLPTGDIWGGKVAAEDLPLDNWFAAMNECDVLIGDRKQYLAGFEINVEEMAPADVIEEMNRASFAQISEFGGVFRVRVGAPSAPVLALTDADFVITESSTLTPFPAFENVTNGITGTYVEPNDIWEGREADLILNEDWVAEDGAQRVSSVGLPAVSVKAQAQHLLNSLLLDARRFVTFQVTLPPSFALVEPLDSISFTSEIYGYTNKVFEVIEVEDRTDTLLQVVVMREREANDTDWGPELDVPAPLPTNGQTPPTPLVVPLSVAAFDLSDATGAARRPAILLSWTIESLPAIRNLKYQVRVKATQEIVAEGIKAVDGGRVLVRGDIIAATEYEVRARYVADSPTAWTPWLSVTTPDLRLTGADLADGAISSTKFADGIEPITIVEGVLPTAKLTEAIMFESKIYRWNGTAYVATVPAVDVTGQLTDAQIAALAAAKLTGQIQTPQIATAAITDAKIAGLAASKVTGQLTDAQIAAVAAAKVTGQIVSAQIADAALTVAKFASGLRPVEIVTSLPTSGNFAGRTVFLTTDNKLYRHTGSPTGSAGFTAQTPAADITGQLTSAQIADLAAAKLTGQITGTQITDNAISAPKISAGAVEAAKIAAGAVIADKIASNAITAVKIQAGAVEAGKIAAGAVTADKVAAGAIIAGKIAAGAVSATEIAAGAVTATKVAIGSFDNLNLDANFDDPTAWSTPSGFSWTSTANITAWGSTRLARLQGDGASYTVSNGQFIIDLDGEGEQLYLRFFGRVVAGGGTVYVDLQLSKNPTFTGVANVDFIYRNVGNTSSSVAEKVEGTTTVPPGYKYARIRLIKGNNGTTDSYIGGVMLRRKSKGQLIVDGAISTDKIDANAVTAAKLAAGAVTADTIASNAITAAKIDAGAITTAKIAAGAVTATEIAAGSVIADKVASNAITAVKLDAGAVTAAKISAGAVETAKLAAGAVTADTVASNAITTVKLNANAVTAAKIAAGTITGDKISANTITAGLIAAGAISATEIATNAITTAKINGRSVTDPNTFFENYGGGTKTPATSPSWNNAADFSVVVPDSGSILLIDCHVNWLLNGSALDKSWGLKFLLDGVAFDSMGGSYFQEQVPFRRAIAVSAGTRAITLQCQRGTGALFLIQNIHSVATILKR